MMFPTSPLYFEKPSTPSGTYTYNDIGVTYTYNHDKAYNIMKANLSKMACFIKYKSYTATNNIPVVLRNVELV